MRGSSWGRVSSWFFGVLLAAPLGCDADRQPDSSGDGNGVTNGGDSDGAGSTTDDFGQDPEACDPDRLIDLGGDAFCCVPPAQLAPARDLLDLTVDLRFNNVAPGPSPADRGDIFLENRATGDRVHVGKTSDAPLRARVLAGRYDLVYEADTIASQMPRNRRALACTNLVVAPTPPPDDAEAPEEPVVPATTSATIACDISVVTLSGSVTFNGAPSASLYDTGRLTLVDARGERTDLSLTHQGALSARVLAGTYDLHYTVQQSSDVTPHNVDARIAAGLDLRADLSVDLDVPVVTLAGAITLGGAAPPDTAYDRAFLYLRDRQSGGLTPLADTRAGAIANVRVVAHPSAAYDLYYAIAAPGPKLPWNRWARLSPEEGLTADQLAAQLQGAGVALSAVDVTASLLVDGQPPPPGAGDGEVLLRTPGAGDGGDLVELGPLSLGAPRPVLKDTYSVFYRNLESSGPLPINRRRRVTDRTIDAPTQLDLSLTTTVVHGAITVAGKPPPSTVYRDGRLYLRGEGGDVVYLGNTRDGAFSRRVVAGTYTLHYAVERAGGGVPANPDVALREVVIAGPDQPLDIDVPLATFAAPPPYTFADSLYDRGAYSLRPIAGGDEIFVGTSADAALAADVVPGDYLLVYRLQSRAALAAENQGAVVGCLTIH